MQEKLILLKSKLEELQTLLKQNVDSYKEVSENINVAQGNKQKLNENIMKIQGVMEGIQFSISNLEEVCKLNPEVKLAPAKDYLAPVIPSSKQQKKLSNKGK